MTDGNIFAGFDERFNFFFLSWSIQIETTLSPYFIQFMEEKKSQEFIRPEVQ